MKTTKEILEELLNESRQIEKFINTHALGYSLHDANLRELYAAHHFYISLERHSAVILLTAEQLRGPALTLIRPMFESWIKGTWIRSVASDDQIEDVTKSSKFWIEKSMRIWDLINEVRKQEDFIGEWMKGLWASLDQYLNDCVHSNNQYLNLYLNKHAQTLGSQIREDLMAVMLDLTNTVALWAARQMRELHTQDQRLLNPLTAKLNEYLNYSTELLEPIRLQITEELSKKIMGQNSN